MRLKFYSIVLILLCACSTAVSSKDINNLGFIIRLIKDTNETYCTGAVIDATHALTAVHCVHDLKYDRTVEIRGSDNIYKGVRAKVLTKITKADIAILEGDFRSFSHANYITDINSLNKIVDKKERIISCGYPYNGNLYCANTEFTRHYGFREATTRILIPGMSGGPTILEDGTIIAINSGTDLDFSTVSLLYNIDKYK